MCIRDRYLPKDLLMLRAAELLGLSVENMEPQLMNLVMDRKLVLKQPAEEKQPLVYGMQAYYAELDVYKRQTLYGVPVLLRETVFGTDG